MIILVTNNHFFHSRLFISQLCHKAYSFFLKHHESTCQPLLIKTLSELGLLLCTTLVLQRQILRNGNFDSGNPSLGARTVRPPVAFLAAALLVATSAMNLAT